MARSRRRASSRRRRSKSSRGSFAERHARSLKLKQILQDIAEARSYGIQLHELTLGELYSYLADARRQLHAFQAAHAGQPFRYDPQESQQFPYEDDGLDALEAAVLQAHAARAKRATASKSDGQHLLRQQRPVPTA
eukprot:15484106-Alexandrium_andersonii.AAC.1